MGQNNDPIQTQSDKLIATRLYLCYLLKFIQVADSDTLRDESTLLMHMGGCPNSILNHFRSSFVAKFRLRHDKAINYVCILLLMTNKYKVHVPWVLECIAAELRASQAKLMQHFRTIGCTVLTREQQATLTAPVKFPENKLGNKERKRKSS